MTTIFSGPMAAPAEDDLLKSVRDKQGAHYNTYWLKDEARGVELLRELFPDAKANDLNFVLFSTSGIHGSYGTIEYAERMFNDPDYARAECGWSEGEPEYVPTVTFLVVHPRIVCFKYGNLEIHSQEDIEFLKQLRQSSWDAVRTIGAPDA